MKVNSRFAVSHVRHLWKSILQPKKSTRYHVYNCDNAIHDNDVDKVDDAGDLMMVMMHANIKGASCEVYQSLLHV